MQVVTNLENDIAREYEPPFANNMQGISKELGELSYLQFFNDLVKENRKSKSKGKVWAIKLICINKALKS